MSLQPVVGFLTQSCGWCYSWHWPSKMQKNTPMYPGLPYHLQGLPRQYSVELLLHLCWMVLICTRLTLILCFAQQKEHSHWWNPQPGLCSGTGRFHCCHFPSPSFIKCSSNSAYLFLLSYSLPYTKYECRCYGSQVLCSQQYPLSQSRTTLNSFSMPCCGLPVRVRVVYPMCWVGQLPFQEMIEVLPWPPPP